MSLGWIKLYANLPEHPKSDALEAALGVARAWTHLVELWLWASRVKPTGDLTGVADLTIAKRAGWAGDASLFVAALRQSGWLGDDGRLHGWDEHQGAHQAKAARDAQRMRDRRATVARTYSDDSATVAGKRREREEERREEEERKEREEKPLTLPAAAAPERQEATETPQRKVIELEPWRRKLTARLTSSPGEQQYWADDPAGVLEARDPDSQPHQAFGQVLRERYPALDGQRGRPSLNEKVTAKWDSWAQKFAHHGARAAYAGLASWIGEGYAQHLRSWERDGHVDVRAMSADRAAAPARDMAKAPRAEPDKHELAEMAAAAAEAGGAP